MNSVIESCLLEKKATIHSRIQRFGPQTISGICRGLNTEWTEADFPKVQASLERLADQLEIIEGINGWVLASEANRRYTLESHRIQVARKEAYDMGLSGICKINKDGNPEPVWADLTRRVSRITEDDVPRSWFAPSGHGAQFREYLEAALADGLAEREKRIDAVASELSDIVKEVTSATNGNGNGHHLDDDEPTEEDLTLIQEIAKLEADVEEYQNKIAALEAQLAASAPTQVQTPQPDTGGTLEGILAALETQLEAASLKAEAAAKAVEFAQEQAELAELGVDQARQRLEAALEAVNTLQSLKEGE